MKRLLHIATASIAWIAIAIQLVYTARYALAAGETPWSAIHGFFSYFTALSNLLVALVLTVPVIAGPGRLGRWFSDPRTTTTAATAIIVVGVVYHLLLSAAYNPRGIEYATDLGLHYMVPGLYTAYWFRYANKSGLRYAHLPVMLIYPAGYGIHTLVRGAWTGKYPYFFLDVNRLGLLVATGNAVGMLAAFAAISALLLWATTRQRVNPAVPPTISDLN